MKAAILKHIEFESPGYFTELFSMMGIKYDIYNLYQGKYPAPDEFDILLIMGGPMSIYDEENYPFIKNDKTLIKAAINKSKKIIGVCLGAQLIADSLGSKVYKNDYDEIGWFPVKRNLKGGMGFLPDVATVLHWHGDTFDLPEGSVHLYSSEACPNQAFIHSNHILALQFHLEMNEEIVSALWEYGKSEIPSGSYVMSRERILEGLKTYSYNNRKMLKSMLRYFLGD